MKIFSKAQRTPGLSALNKSTTFISQLLTEILTKPQSRSLGQNSASRSLAKFSLNIFKNGKISTKIQPTNITHHCLTSSE